SARGGRRRKPLAAVGAVVEDGVPLHEGAAARVLACEPDGDAFHDERTERGQFTEAPVDAASAAHRLTLLQQLLELGVDGEAVRDIGVGLADAGQGLRGDRGGY